MNSGPGYGGSCFKKDILNLVYLSEHFGLPEVANLWNSVVTLNTWHQKRLATLITKKLFGTLSNKIIVILGFAFKANTNDTRESAAIKICKDLLDEGAILKIHDPKVSAMQIEKELNLSSYKSNESGKENFTEGSWNKIEDMKNIFNNADAVVILTEWEQYKNMNWIEISNKMRRPSWAFDVRSIVDPKEVINSGINFWRIGDGSQYQDP